MRLACFWKEGDPRSAQSGCVWGFLRDYPPRALPSLFAALPPVLRTLRNDHHKKHHASCTGVTLVHAVTSWPGIWFLPLATMNHIKEVYQKLKRAMEVKAFQGELYQDPAIEIWTWLSSRLTALCKFSSWNLTYEAGIVSPSWHPHLSHVETSKLL